MCLTDLGNSSCWLKFVSSSLSFVAAYFLLRNIVFSGFSISVISTSLAERKPAFSNPISTKAACIPGNTLITFPLYILPTISLLVRRSINISASWLFSLNATRVSRELEFINISEDILRTILMVIFFLALIYVRTVHVV